MSERMIKQFIEMVKIDSESGKEAQMIDYLLKEFINIDAEAEKDSYGNLIAKLPAKDCDGKEPILLSCHADTVKPGVGIEPVLQDGVIRSKDDTILAADDKAGIAEMLEAFRIAEIRPPIEIAISRQEEVGLIGVKNLDFSKITAKKGFLFDNDTLDIIVIGGPSYFAIDAATTFITVFTDASIYNNQGIEMPVVGIGAQLEHSLDEHIFVEDMEKALIIIVELLRLSSE